MISTITTKTVMAGIAAAIEAKKRMILLYRNTKKRATDNRISTPNIIRFTGNVGKETLFPFMDNSKRKPRKEKEKANRKPCLNDQG